MRNGKEIAGFSVNDGTLVFYSFVNALLRNDSTVIDFGAGRGRFMESAPTFICQLRNLSGKVAEVIGIDVDKDVLLNRSVDRSMIVDPEAFRLPLEDQSVDIILSDYVLEHIKDLDAVYAEWTRVLKPHGWICARTPHAWNYTSLVARLIPRALTNKIVGTAQPNRKEIDIFPTDYTSNSLGALRRLAQKHGLEDFSCFFRVEPAYFFGSSALFAFLSFLHRILPDVLVSNIFVFQQKGS